MSTSFTLPNDTTEFQMCSFTRCFLGCISGKATSRSRAQRLLRASFKRWPDAVLHVTNDTITVRVPSENDCVGVMVYWDR